jgi:hypothetical protein
MMMMVCLTVRLSIQVGDNCHFPIDTRFFARSPRRSLFSRTFSRVASQARHWRPEAKRDNVTQAGQSSRPQSEARGHVSNLRLAARPLSPAPKDYCLANSGSLAASRVDLLLFYSLSLFSTSAIFHSSVLPDSFSSNRWSLSQLA